jgi:hypothetical protein
LVVVGFVLGNLETGTVGCVVVGVVVAGGVGGGVCGGGGVVNVSLGSSAAIKIRVEVEVVACVGGHEAAHCWLSFLGDGFGGREDGLVWCSFWARKVRYSMVDADGIRSVRYLGLVWGY